MNYADTYNLYVRSVCGRALSCLASAASNSRSEVVAAVKKSVYSRAAVDPLVATPSSESCCTCMHMVIVQTFSYSTQLLFT